MSRTKIVTDILEEAQRKADAMLSESEKTLHSREQSLLERERQVAADGEVRIEEQQREINARNERLLQRARDRITFDVQKRAIREVEGRVRDHITTMRESEPAAYHRMLLNWTTEAIVGVGTEEPITLSVAGEDRTFLMEQIDQLRSLVSRHCEGSPPEITIADTTLPAGATGVVARNASGRRGFSNTLDDRLRRYEREIQRIIMENLFVRSEEWVTG